MSQNATIMGGRFWGPCAPEDAKVDLRSLSQASLLLARINARARAKKASRANVTSSPSSEAQKNSKIHDMLEEGTQKPSDVETSIDMFLEEMRNVSSRGEVENIITHDGETGKKKRKKKNKDNGDMTVKTEDSITVKIEECEVGIEIDGGKTEQRKKHDDSSVTVKNEENQHLKFGELLNSRKKKKKPKVSGKFISEAETRTSGLEATGAGENLCDTEIHTPKKRKRNRECQEVIFQNEVPEENDTFHLDDSGWGNKSKKKKEKFMKMAECKENEGSRGGSLKDSLQTPVAVKMENSEEEFTEKTEVSGDISDTVGAGESCNTLKRKEKKKNKEKESSNEVITPSILENSGPPEGEAEIEIPKKKTGKPKPTASNEMDEEEVTKEEITDALSKEGESRMKRKKSKKKRQKVKKEIGFTLLKGIMPVQKEKLHRTLPHWLAHPTLLSRDLQVGVGAGLDVIAGLSESMKRKLKWNKITHFFPVQCAVIPEILAATGPIAGRYRPRDICVSAPTGCGKTLAFVLPILQALRGRTVPRIRALVLLPVQELAHQVYQEFKKYTDKQLKIGIAAGKISFKKEQEDLVCEDYRGHYCLVDVLVATPGRLADHLAHTPGLDFSALRYLVLDEADRMLAEEGGEWVARIEQAVSNHTSFARDSSSLYAPPPPHRLLFSATLSHDPELLQHFTLYHPRLFTVAGPPSCSNFVVTKTDGLTVSQYVRPTELLEEYVVMEEEVKPLVLHHLVTGRAGLEGVWQKVLIFTNSLSATHRLAVLLSYLAPDRTVAEFNSLMRNQKNGQRVLAQFKAGKIDILVASDAMARGMDIPDVEYVVSYDVTSVNNYIHRIGRTARAGKPGTAISLVTRDELSEFRAASRSGEDVRELTVTTEELEPYEEKYTEALTKLKELLKEEQHLKRKVLEMGSRKKTAGGQGVAKKQSINGRKPIKRLQDRLNHLCKPFKLR